MKWFRQNWQRCVVWTLVLAILCYVLALPVLQTLITKQDAPSASFKMVPQSVFETINQRAMESLFAVLFFSFGAAIGSFLNVVAYRVPLNRSIVFQSSGCPKCGNRIAAKDNFPVFGWFLLKGRCRNCQLPISIRYPIVEAITGSVFCLLYFRELISGGANLPLREMDRFRGAVWIVMCLDFEMLAIYIYHCIWLLFLMVWALFAWDGNRIPKRAGVFAFFALAVPPLVLTYLSQVPFDYVGGQIRLNLNPWVRAGASVGIGALVGLLLSVVFKEGLLSTLSGFQSPSSKFSTPDSGEFKAESTTPLLSDAQESFDLPASVENSRDDVIVNEISARQEVTPSKIGESCSSIENADGEPDEKSLSQTIERTTENPNSSCVLKDSIYASLICTGVAVGWQGLMGITLLMLVGRMLCWFDRSKRVWAALPFPGWFMIAALIHHFFWRTFFFIW